MLDGLKYRITNLKEIENKLKDQKNQFLNPSNNKTINKYKLQENLFQVTTKERPKLIQSTKAYDSFIEENATLLSLIQEKLIRKRKKKLEK